MSVQRIASRYAKSLIELADEQGKLDTILSDFKSFSKVTENRDFSLMLKSPIIKVDKKKAIFDALFVGKLDVLTNTFFEIVLRKGRESFLPAIAKEFQRQYSVLKHISSVRLVTATKLSDTAFEAIKNQIESSDATDDHVDLVVDVDESLIGGFIIEFDNKRFDTSVAHKLALLKKEFDGNEYTKEYY